MVHEQMNLILATISPLALVTPLLTTPLLYHVEAYTLLSARTAVWQWDTPLAPLIQWFQAALFPAFRGVETLPPLYMAYHTTIRIQRLLNTMVPKTTLLPSAQPTYTVQAPSQQEPAPDTPKKTGMPAEHW